MYKRIITMITIISLGLVVFIPSAFGAVSYDSFIIDQTVASTQRYVEFQTTPLNYSYSRPTGDANRPTYDSFASLISSGKSITHFKISPDGVASLSNYYSATALAYNYPRNNSDLVLTVQNTTPIKMITGIVRNLNSAAVFEGPIITDTTSSLALARTADAKVWNCTEKSANASNDIGPVKFIFAKDIDKTAAGNVTILINGVAPSESDDALIKSLLFGEFVTNATDSTANVLDGDIAMTYNQLKTALAIYNNDVAVTTVKLTVKNVGSGTGEMTLNII